MNPPISVAAIAVESDCYASCVQDKAMEHCRHTRGSSLLVQWRLIFHARWLLAHTLSESNVSVLLQTLLRPFLNQP